MSNPQPRRFITAKYNQSTMVNQVSLTDNEDLAYSYETRELAAIALDIAKAQGITEPLEIMEVTTHEPVERTSFRLVTVVKEEPRTWRNQFPTTFALPDELDRLVKFGLLEDTSWGNDVAPSFEFDGYESSKEAERRFHREGLKPSRYRVWSDAENPELREFGTESKRFSLFFRDEDERERANGTVLFDTDDVNEMIDAITLRFFQAFAWSIDNGPWFCPFRDCESSDIDTNEADDSYGCNDCGRVWTLIAVSRITGAVIDQGLRQCRDCDRTEGLIISKCEGDKLQFCPDHYKVHTTQGVMNAQNWKE